MPAFIALAATLIPQLISAGMAIEPVIERLISVDKNNITDADWKFLHDAQAAALAIINDRSRDVR